MDFVALFAVIVILLFAAFYPYDEYLTAIARKIAEFLRKRNNPNQSVSSRQAKIGLYNMQVILWRNNIPMIDRLPVQIKNEEDGKAMIIAVAKEKANEYKLEVSTALYVGERLVSSFRAWPVPT